jgi:hypothetical protein
MIHYTTDMISIFRNTFYCSIYEFETICKEKKSCHEIIDNGKPVKLYYDIEFDSRKIISKEEKYTKNELDDITFSLINMSKEIIKEYLHHFFKREEEPQFVVKVATNEDYIDSTGKRTWKISFHIIVKNYSMFKRDQYHFTKFLNRIFLTEEKYNIQNIINCYDHFHFFDESIYHLLSKVRTVHSNRPLEDRPFVLFEGEFIDSLITNTDEHCQQCILSQEMYDELTKSLDK